jgi:hypothetical protein
MGKGDFSGREQKKQKKDNKKPLTSVQPLRPVVEVEVVGKKKKKSWE